MDLFDVARSCFRRWYVVLPLLLVALWYSHKMYTSAKPVYYSNAVISVAAPSTRVDQAPVGVPIPRNGLLDLGGASLITNMAAIGLRDPDVVAKIVAAGGRPDYTSRMFPVPGTMPELPLVMIEATEPDPASASKTVELVVAQADSTLRTLQQQADVPDDQMVKPFVVSPPSAPVSGMPSRTKSTISVFVAGAGLAVLAGVVADVFLTRWKARRQKRQRIPAAPQSVDAADAAEDDDSQNSRAADEVAMDSR